MPASYSLAWRGGAIVGRTKHATRQGLEETLARCVTMAMGLVRVEFGTLQGSLRYEMLGNEEGEWGSFDVNYALFQELGTWKMTAKPYLRPSADFEYPMLAARIRRAMAMGA
jgi:hypothetical protein